MDDDSEVDDWELDDWELDDWELDDWDDEAFDDDVWDTHQADLVAAVELDDPDHFDDPGPSTGSGAGAAAVSAGWSAWEVGTVFAMGGWLADRHAEEVGRQVADALRPTHPPAAANHGPRADRRSAPHPPPATGYPYEVTAPPPRIGDPLDQGRLFADVIAALAASADRVIQAEGHGPAGGRLVLIVTVVATSAGPLCWVVAEEQPQGFAATRLMPVFQPDRQAGVAVFATDYATEAADAAMWACQREGVTIDALTVTHRR